MQIEEMCYFTPDRIGLECGTFFDLIVSGEKMVRLTQKASMKVKDILKKEKLNGYGLRVAIVGGGLNGFEYTIAFCKEKSGSDLVFDSFGIKIFVDPTSYPYLENTLIDYVKNEKSEGFIFVNPKPLSLNG